MFDAMPACWKHLDEAQRREVAALIGSFYDASRVDASKDPWSIENVKKYLNLGYVKLDDIYKFRAAYLATLQDDSLFVEPPFFSPASDTDVASSNLLEKHDGFALKPKKLMEEYEENRHDVNVQAKVFNHFSNFVCTKHVVDNKKKKSQVQLEPTPGLNVELSEDQRRLLNPTVKDVQISELIDQAQGERARKKEAKRRQDIFSGNIGSYSAILNSDDKLQNLKDYNDLSASVAIYNAEKDAKAKASSKKKAEEAAERAKNKANKEAEQAKKRDELLPGLQQELLQKGSAILDLPDKRLREYIRYFFQKKVVNLQKTKKEQLKAILAPLVEQHQAVIAPLEASASASDSGVSADANAGGDGVAESV